MKNKQQNLFNPDRPKVPAGGITGTPLSITDLMGLHNAVAGDFTKIWEKGEENEQRWIGNNWTESKRAKVRRQKRQAYSLPILASKLRYISATQKQLRTSFRVNPISDPNDEVKAELATLQMKQVEARSNSKYTDSDVFESGLAIKYGVKKVWLDETSPIPKVITPTVDWKNFVWDLNAREYEVRKDAMWMAEVDRVTREYLNAKFGKNAGIGVSANQGNLAFTGRDKINYWIRSQTLSDSENNFDLITLFCHCQMTKRTYYYVLFPDSVGIHKLPSPLVGRYKIKSEAESALRQLQIPYAMQGLPEEGEVMAVDRPAVDYYEFVGNKILYFEETDWEYFPYDVYFSIKFEDKFCSYQDFLNDPQLIIDRMWSQIDYSMGRDIKNVYEGNASALDPTKETPESATLKANTTGGIIWTQSKDQVFRAIQSQGANPQWINAIEAMIKYLEDMSGGRTFQGMAESSGQSGRAIKNLQQAGQVMSSAFLDAFNRFKKSLGENVLWWIKEYENEEDTIRVLGGMLTKEMIDLLKQEDLFQESLSYNKDGTGYVTINKGGISYLKDAQVELIIQEEGMTETAKEKRYVQLNEVAVTDPNMAMSPTFRQLRLESMDISWADKQKIIQETEAIAKKQQEALQQQQQLEQQKVQMQYGKDDLDKEEQQANTAKSKMEAFASLNFE